MSEEINTQAVNETNAAGAENTAGASETAQTDTERFEQFIQSDTKLQGEFDRRVNKALQTAKANWQREQLESQDEAKKLEKMTQAQRDAYNLEKSKAEFEKEKQAFALEQMKVATGAELQKRGLDASFAEFLTAPTAEQVNANISAFEKVFNLAVQRSTNDKMRGDKPPKENEKSDSAEDAFLKGFTAKI